MRRNLVQENMDAILRLASLSELRITTGHLDAAGGAVRSTAAFDLRIAYGDAVDKQAEIARLKKEIDRLAKDIDSKQKRLADENFTSKAPEKVVDGLRATLVERQLELKKLRDRLQQLE
jgi:valyl-tRNA synthetase